MKRNSLSVFPLRQRKVSENLKRNCLFFFLLCQTTREVFLRLPPPRGAISVTNRHPEMPFFFLPKTAAQKDQKHPSSKMLILTLLTRVFQKHPKVFAYLIKEHLDTKKKSNTAFRKVGHPALNQDVLGPRLASPRIKIH